jgi:hypothetical protein
MQRIRIQRPKGRRQRRWGEVLPLDPRDPQVLRAKALGRSPGGLAGQQGQSNPDRSADGMGGRNR